MTKRTEVKVNSGQGKYHWAPAQVIGEEDGMLIVEYRDFFGHLHEGMFYPQSLREVNAEITDELLQEAANASIKCIKQYVLMLDDAELEAAGQQVLSALRLHFSYPSKN